ncbi:MAG: 6-phospho-beta-glucosidase [Lactimicrobium massiliense]|nr:6-phospho-beta-glucosidase [Lactimicrobium massiliense]MDD6230150.1 6-phospho-beta-glucosidase [Lactimicrobium massiliense]
MKGVKIVTIGGGSSYTPELMQGFIKRYKTLPIREIWLVDIPDGKKKLEIVGALAQRMWDASGYDVKVHLTLDRREALKDADFVTTQFRVGLLNARIKDERIPLSHGMIGQETNGAGGMFKLLRTAPVIAQIIQDMKELCPNAWLINFTNPSGMITETVIRQCGWKKCIGLCNVPVNIMKNEPVMIGKKEGDLDFVFGGLNHFHFHRAYDKKTGQEVTHEIARAMMKDDKSNMANIQNEKFLLDQLLSMDCLPCGYHRYYYLTSQMRKKELEDYAEHKTRAEMVKEVEHQLFELYKDPALHEMPELLGKRGGKYYSDAACETINAIYNDTGRVMVVSTENKGALVDLDPQAIVEVSARITRHGAEPIAFGRMEPAVRGMVQLMKAMEETIIDAALHGDYGKALEAFQINPLVDHGQCAQDLLNEMLVANEKYLPNFHDKIEELKQAGVTVQDETARQLCEKGL